MRKFNNLHFLKTGRFSLVALLAVVMMGLGSTRVFALDPLPVPGSNIGQSDDGIGYEWTAPADGILTLEYENCPGDPTLFMSFQYFFSIPCTPLNGANFEMDTVFQYAVVKDQTYYLEANWSVANHTGHLTTSFQSDGQTGGGETGGGETGGEDNDGKTKLKFYPDKIDLLESGNIKYYYTPASNGTLTLTVLSGVLATQDKDIFFVSDGTPVKMASYQGEFNGPLGYETLYVSEATWDLSAGTEYYFLYPDNLDHKAVYFSFDENSAGGEEPEQPVNQVEEINLPVYDITKSQYDGYKFTADKTGILKISFAEYIFNQSVLFKSYSNGTFDDYVPLNNDFTNPYLHEYEVSSGTTYYVSTNNFEGTFSMEIEENDNPGGGEDNPDLINIELNKKYSVTSDNTLYGTISFSSNGKLTASFADPSFGPIDSQINYEILFTDPQCNTVVSVETSAGEQSYSVKSNETYYIKAGVAPESLFGPKMAPGFPLGYNYDVVFTFESEGNSENPGDGGEDNPDLINIELNKKYSVTSDNTLYGTISFSSNGKLTASFADPLHGPIYSFIYDEILFTDPECNTVVPVETSAGEQSYSVNPNVTYYIKAGVAPESIFGTQLVPGFPLGYNYDVVFRLEEGTGSVSYPLLYLVGTVPGVKMNENIGSLIPVSLSDGASGTYFISAEEMELETRNGLASFYLVTKETEDGEITARYGAPSASPEYLNFDQTLPLQKTESDNVQPFVWYTGGQFALSVNLGEGGPTCKASAESYKYPSKAYIVGNVNGHVGEWVANNYATMEEEKEGVYTISDVALNGSIAFSTGKAESSDDWSNLNALFTPQNGNKKVTTEEVYDVVLYPYFSSRPECFSFMPESGYYDVTFNLDNNYGLNPQVTFEPASVKIELMIGETDFSQSGTIEGAHIEMESIDEDWKKSIVIYVFSPEGTEIYFRRYNIQGVTTENARMAVTPYASDFSDYEDSEFKKAVINKDLERKTIILPVNTTGTFDVYYQNDDNSVKSATKTYTYQVKVGVPTGVEEVETADEAGAVYYNLQGMKVENPGNGIYIKVSGGKTQKVMIRK